MTPFHTRLFQIYDFIDGYTQQNGETPRYREIALALGITASTVKKHVRKMEQVGMICRVKKRTITLVRCEPDWNMLFG